MTEKVDLCEQPRGDRFEHIVMYGFCLRLRFFLEQEEATDPKEVKFVLID